MASEESSNYLSGLCLLVGNIILSLTCSKLQNDSIQDTEVDNRFENFADLVSLDAKLVAGFSPPCQFRLGTRTK